MPNMTLREADLMPKTIRTCTSTPLSRREMLQRTALGFGGLALSYLLNGDTPAFGTAHTPDLRPRPGHSPAPAKAIIMLAQTGGPSQMDLFDPKPELQKQGGKKAPFTVDKFLPGNSDTLLASPFRFRRWGQCGTEISELIPHTAVLADDLCLVRSMFTGHENHTEGMVMLNTGKFTMGRPALGAWVSYGLGSVSRNLPAYVVLRDPSGYDTAGSLSWSPGWLPALYGGTEFSSKGAPVHHLQPPGPIDPKARQDDLDFLNRLNEEHRKNFRDESELEARIRNYELAARMQMSAGQALDLSKEPASIRKLYGLDDPATNGYGTRCLLARRLIEAGVRFVQVYPDQIGQVWDTHSKQKPDLEKVCRATDLPTAGLIRDLKARGLLEETIVLWAGEFGRLPVSQNADGRDHNRHAFSLFLTGGGFVGGLTYGTTDDFGYKAMTDKVSVASLHATILHQLGLDHERLSYPHHGREETLTDATTTKARVVERLVNTPG